MSEWKEFKLKDFAQINPKETLKKGVVARKIAMENLSPFKKKIEGWKEASFNGGSKFINGDTLLARITPCLENGKTAFVDVLENDEVAFGSTEFIVLRENPEVSDRKFLYYFAISPEFRDEAILAMTGSSGRQRVEIEAIANRLFEFPPLPEQKAIAEVLTSLDDKIDLLHKQNKTLEQLAETLFRHHFIDNAQDDWENVELGSVVETTSGGTPSRSNIKFYQNGSLPWIKSKELNGKFILETEEKITEEAVKKSSAKLLPQNSILVAMYGATVGEYAISSEAMTCNQAICAIKPNDSYPYTYLFLFIKTHKQDLINRAVGSAQQNISQILIKSLLLPKCLDKIKDFHFFIESNFEKIKENQKQIRNLEKLRDQLLPKLMSGEIRLNQQMNNQKL